MCSPTLIVGGTMAATSALQGMGQRDVVKQTNKIKRGIAARNEASAIESSARTMEQVAIRNRQAQFAAGQQGRKIAVQSAMARGQMSAGAASAGVEGLTIEDLSQDFDVQEGLAMAALSKQREFDLQSDQNQLAQINLQTQSRINASAPNLSPVPTMLGVGMNALGAGMSGALMGQQFSAGGGFFGNNPG